MLHPGGTGSAMPPASLHVNIKTHKLVVLEERLVLSGQLRPDVMMTLAIGTWRAPVMMMVIIGEVGGGNDGFREVAARAVAPSRARRRPAGTPPDVSDGPSSQRNSSFGSTSVSSRPWRRA
jgi:hypothetical protein